MIRNMLNFFSAFGLILSLSVPMMATAEEGDPADDTNRTSLVDGTVGSEQYIIELMAPLVDGNVFPVPVEYFDDLLQPGKKLKAMLMVPARLTVKNSRERRLLTVFSSNAEKPVKYKENLKNVSQIDIRFGGYNQDNPIIEDFVGPNKRIFRIVTDASDYEIDFAVPVTHKHFHGGHIRVSVAASNGVQLNKICEVDQSDCLHEVSLKVVPRQVEYHAHMKDTSYITDEMPLGDFKITQSDVDLRVRVHNQEDSETVLSRHNDINVEGGYVINGNKDYFRPLDGINPHTTVNAPTKVFAGHVDIYPIIHYMSNDRYSDDDYITSTKLVRRPDSFVVKKEEAIKLLKKLEAAETFGVNAGNVEDEVSEEDMEEGELEIQVEPVAEEEAEV